MSSDGPITWEVDIPLLTNPYVTGPFLKAMFWVYVACVGLMGTIFLATGEPEAIPAILGIFALGVGGITLVGLLIMPIWFGRSYRARFTLSDDGILYEGVDTRGRTAARMAVLAGAVTGNLAAVGAGAGAMASEQEILEWDGAFFMVPVAKRRVLVFKNAWRDVMHVYCTPENYEYVLGRVEKQMADNQTAERLQVVEGKSPIPGGLGRTLTVAAASFPIFAMVDFADLHLMVPIFVLVFALATVWIIPFLAWVLFPALGWVVFAVAAELLSTRELTLVSTYSFRGWEGLDVADWGLVFLVLAGVGYLAWFSYQAVTGRYLSVLIRDKLGMGY